MPQSSNRNTIIVAFIGMLNVGVIAWLVLRVDRLESANRQNESGPSARAESDARDDAPGNAARNPLSAGARRVNPTSPTTYGTAPAADVPGGAPVPTASPQRAAPGGSADSQARADRAKALAALGQPDDAPLAVPEMPEAREFVRRTNLDPVSWQALMRVNNQWVAALESAQREGATPAVEAAYTRYRTDLDAVLRGVPDGQEKYRQFLSQVPGSRVRIATGAGNYDAVHFK